jgi:hypothetical protein
VFTGEVDLTLAPLCQQPCNVKTGWGKNDSPPEADLLDYATLKVSKNK